MIALVDYGMGNLRSVEKALQHVGGQVQIVKKAPAIAEADALVLPGVGAFGDCMKNLTRQRLIEPLKTFLRSGKPFLGICLGYQALFESSEEDPGIPGLAILKGRVVRFPSRPGLKVPQIGWNRLKIQRPDCPLLRGLRDGAYFYFVHSYYPQPDDSVDICTETDYGIRFASMVWHDRIFACQFHPEKSQDVGLKMLENFVRL